METINSRFASIIKELGHSGNSMAKALEVNASVINSITGPRQAKPGSDLLEKLKSKFPRLDLNWLVTGEGEPLRPYKGNESEGSNSNKARDAAGILQQAGHLSRQTVNLGLPECLERLHMLEQRLADKDELLQAKEEVISLLKKQAEGKNFGE